MKDLSLLKDLYLLERHYGEEYKVVSFIINYCYKHFPNNLTFELDEYGNLFIIKNTSNPKTYPCVIAHMDCVQAYSTSRTLSIYNSKIYAFYNKTNKIAGLGADDSNGIWIALKLLNEVPNLKIVFTCEEECGGCGAEKACSNKQFFSNVKYLLQADRRGKSDLITFTNGLYITNYNFLSDIQPIMKKYNYAERDGIFTDVGILSENLKLSGVNISCGYYNEHTDKEYTNLAELKNCYNFIKEIILTLTEDTIYTIDPPKSIYKSTVPFYTDFPCDHCKTFDCMNCKHIY